jgi:hypothetical protein
VVSTPLKNISQIGSSSQLLGKIKNVPNHQPDLTNKHHEGRVFFDSHFPGQHTAVIYIINVHDSLLFWGFIQELHVGLRM